MDALFTQEQLNALITGFTYIVDFAENTILVDVTISGERFVLSVATAVLSAIVFRFIVGFLTLPWHEWHGSGGEDDD